MNLKQLVDIAKNKTNFATLPDYLTFCLHYIDFITTGLQAEIVAQNETDYRFFQYDESGHFNITRPINSKLFIRADQIDVIEGEFVKTLKGARDIAPTDATRRAILNNGVYTIQQAIGAALDALPAGESNTARKIAGDLFERLVRLLIRELDITCVAGTVQVPVIVDGQELFKMAYQHDMLIKDGEELKVIGSVKTSSKDRIDKIFLDKFLYCKLTDTAIPHIAVFLNDVQRKPARRPNQYSINSTFLSGHFKGFTVKLNPLDGVYYCDIRPNMIADPLLSEQIDTLDRLFCNDLWSFLEKPGIAAETEPKGELGDSEVES
ncbi:MAG: hypothetical protein M3O61_13630 [Gemmatimonadota bacterium]|nr:hypothetical protein [Gemmatimonadota bacterium]